MKTEGCKNTQLVKRRRKLTVIFLIIICVLGILGIFKSFFKLTYLEYEMPVNVVDGEKIEISNTGEILVQDFQAPYDLIQGIAIKIETFSRDNNSLWNIALIEKTTGEILYREDYNASFIEDDSFHLFEFKKNIRVEKGAIYQIQVTPRKVQNNTSLSFYYMPESDNNNQKLIYNGTAIDGKLCFSIYGGDTDYWWTGYVAVIMLLAISVVIRAYFVSSRNRKLSDDRILMSLITGAIVILLLSSFAVSEAFTDESDNIRGGMIIAKGGVLYRDYVTQHPPIAYYLCSIFALLGAGSIEQFRLSYYLFVALIWGGIYYRHSRYFGKKRMLLLAILESVFIFSIAGGYLILSDGIQGLCMVVILLEFIEYYHDKKLGWDRSIIISLCIWGSFGSAFISVYALIWIFVAFLLIEISDWAKNGASFKAICLRYNKLIVSIVLPLVCAIVYFKINGTLGRAFEQIYSFNREVYPEYTSGLGSNVLQPFINAMQNFFGIVSDDINAIITASASDAQILKFIILLFAIAAIIIILVQKRYMEAFVIFMVMCCSATRGYGFHGLAAWYIAIMTITISLTELRHIVPTKTGAIIMGITCIYLLSPYVVMVGGNLLHKQTSISEIESDVVAITEDGEGILIDAWNCDSIYLLYKDRYPINRAVYMLPWYMDWYEQDIIEDLNNNMPNVVVYREDTGAWGYTCISNAFYEELKKHYIRFSENPNDGWMYSVWIKID